MEKCLKSTTENEKPAQQHVYGPSLPPVVKEIGPVLPPHLLKSIKQDPSNNDDSSSSTSTARQATTIGPCLPPNFTQPIANNASSSHNHNSDDDDDVYGPIPADDINSFSRAHLALEERALQLKMDQLEPEDDDSVQREEWMLELPSVTASNLGLGPRQFRSKTGPDLSNRSVWTDTPQNKADKGKKLEKEGGSSVGDLKREAELKAIRERDEEQESISKKCSSKKKHKQQSLMDMHQDKLKKLKKDKSSESNERKPFNRDTDLQVNRFDNAQKKAILKKSQMLNDRFSRGRSKFL